MLRAWYARHGRHDLAWRAHRDRWPVLVSELMLHQTQVPRVAKVWPEFIGCFPTPEAMAQAGPGPVIAAWGRLGYPRRARRLWESAVIIAERGWPDDLTTLPGVGRYTAAAIRAQADDADEVAAEVNIRRVAERAAGRRLTPREAEQTARDLGRPLTGRDRLLALMDVGGLLCKPRDPKCNECPLAKRCASQGPRDDESRRPPPKYEGSFRQRRGRALAKLRAGPTPTTKLDREALTSLVEDGLAETANGTARLPSDEGARQGGGGSPKSDYGVERSSTT